MHQTDEMLSVDDFIPWYPQTSESTDIFNTQIARKREFNELALARTEGMPERRGELLAHQRLLARFMSSHTPYAGIIVFHEMGTGKSCTAVAIMEEILNDQTNGIDAGMYITRGKSLLDNFKHEIVYKCTDGRYDNADSDDDDAIHMPSRYTGHTFRRFANRLNRMSDDMIASTYSDRVIVVDEIHNIRDRSGDQTVYRAFFRFLHVVRNCKIVLMSGTPMKDDASELYDALNLILPHALQITPPYYDLDDPTDVEMLRTVLTGRVSYLKAQEIGVERRYMGTPMGTLEHLNVVDTSMGVVQSRAYARAYARDTGVGVDDVDDATSTHEGSIYTNSRQASLFVFPNETWGSAGFDRYVRTTRVNAGQNRALAARINARVTFTLAEGLVSAIRTTRDASHADMLRNLERYSGVYAASIRRILADNASGRLSYVYNEFVRGSGLILFSRILELFGFSRYTGRERSETIPTAQRYALLTSATTSPAQATNIVRRYNQRANATGGQIGVVIGSKQVAEGISFKRVRTVIVQTPWYNYATITQAVARAIRFDSHIDLSPPNRTVDIFLCVAVPMGEFATVPSIDLKMYQWGEPKDREIKRMERIVATSAWDCALTHERNARLMARDGERACEYDVCDYVCDYNPAAVDRTSIDETTYRLFYNTRNIERSMDQIRDRLATTVVVAKSDLLANDNSFNTHEAIARVANGTTPVRDPFGRLMFAHMASGYIYLAPTGEPNTIDVAYYTANPTIAPAIAYDAYVDRLIDASWHTHMNAALALPNDRIGPRLLSFPRWMQDIVVEGAVSARARQDGDKTTAVRDRIIELYMENGVVEHTNGVWTSNMRKGISLTRRVLGVDGVWRDDDIVQYRPVDELIANRYYALASGAYDGTVPEFCIRDNTQTQTVKKHTRTTGRVCTTWSKKAILSVIDDMKIQPPAIDDMEPKDVRTFETIEGLDRAGLSAIVARFIPSASVDGSKPIASLRTLAWWSKITTKNRCAYLYTWFVSAKLIGKDAACGGPSKKK
jgi:hypothetical protein